MLDKKRHVCSNWQIAATVIHIFYLERDACVIVHVSVWKMCVLIYDISVLEILYVLIYDICLEVEDMCVLM